MNKKTLFILVFLIILVMALSFFNLKPEIPNMTGKPEYKEVTSYGDQNYLYECSRPIRVRLERGVMRQVGIVDDYVPVDMAEAKLFCHSTAVIEYKGKLTVLQKPEVLEMISRYEYKDVTIKALEFEYIQDKELVHRLLPDYKDQEIGCIIVLQTPDGGMVYLEDEELETFEELDYQTFIGYLNKVSPADKQLFLDNLQ